MVWKVSILNGASYICIIYILERNDLSIVVTVREREEREMKCEEINDNQN